MPGFLNALLGFLKPGGAGFTIIQTFTSSTTWICPAGVTEVEYLVVAGGGEVVVEPEVLERTEELAEVPEALGLEPDFQLLPELLTQ